MKLSANGKEYIVEFTFEAAESEVVQTAFDYFSGAYMFKGITDSENEVEQRVAQVNAAISGISAVPRLAVDLLYMGLLEYHGKNDDGDGTVTCRDDARRIYKQFCKENPDDERSKQLGLFNALRDQMEEDGFFDRIGLTEVMERMSQPEEQEKKLKIPQDRKKSTKTSKTS